MTNSDPIDLLKNIFPKVNCSLITRCFFLGIMLIILTPLQSYAHEGEEEEIIVLSRFIDENIIQEADPDLEQWEQSYQVEIESEWEKEIFLSSINNGTHVFFLLSWDDPTMDIESKDGDGASIILEIEPEDEQYDEDLEPHASSEEEKEVWFWIASKNYMIKNNVITKAEWADDQWNVLFVREIGISEIDDVVFLPGIKQEGLLKFLVWDGSKSESFEDVDVEELEHIDFILLPEIDIYPKDAFVWSALLVAGAISFVFVERKLHTQKESEL